MARRHGTWPRHRALLRAAVVGAAVAGAAGCVGPRDVPWSMRTLNKPAPPFRVAGNIHYVGTNEMAIFLITTPAGHILIDSGFEAGVPRLRDNIRQLGFRFEDIELVLSSHAHIDHVQGHAEVRRLTGARVLASERDRPVIAGGGQGDWLLEGSYRWTPSPVDGVVADGQRVELGGTTLVAHLTPGHTRGATTWTTTVEEEGRRLAVVFFPSASVLPGMRLLDNHRYPEIAADFRRSFQIWRALRCDVFLGSHAHFFGMADKRERLAAGERPNPFIDPRGYADTIAAAEKRFTDIYESER